MFNVKTTEQFDIWLKSLKNPIAKKMIVTRIHRLEVFGHFGDVEYVGDGISELRFHNHGGIRIYFIQQGDTIILLLLGGDKSTQKADIIQAKQISDKYLEKNNETDE